MSETKPSGHLVIICGLPGTGKTTLAKRIEQEAGAIRMSPDDWMAALAINIWESDARDKVEGLQWILGKRLLALGMTVIIEWGTWGRDERDTLRTEARAIGASVELHYLSAPLDELFERIQRRGLEDPPMKKEDVPNVCLLIPRSTITCVS